MRSGRTTSSTRLLCIGNELRVLILRPSFFLHLSRCRVAGTGHQSWGGGAGGLPVGQRRLCPAHGRGGRILPQPRNRPQSRLRPPGRNRTVSSIRSMLSFSRVTVEVQSPRTWPCRHRVVALLPRNHFDSFLSHVIYSWNSSGSFRKGSLLFLNHVENHETLAMEWSCWRILEAIYHWRWICLCWKLSYSTWILKSSVKLRDSQCSRYSLMFKENVHGILISTTIAIF